METKQSQIKINLPLKLKKKMEARADKYDMTLAGYMKHLMVKELEINVEPSEETKRIIEEIKSGKGKFIKVKNTKEYFDSL